MKCLLGRGSVPHFPVLLEKQGSSPYQCVTTQPLNTCKPDDAFKPNPQRQLFSGKSRF